MGLLRLLLLRPHPLHDASLQVRLVRIRRDSDVVQRRGFWNTPLPARGGQPGLWESVERHGLLPARRAVRFHTLQQPDAYLRVPSAPLPLRSHQPNLGLNPRDPPHRGQGHRPRRGQRRGPPRSLLLPLRRSQHEDPAKHCGRHPHGLMHACSDVHEQARGHDWRQPRRLPQHRHVARCWGFYERLFQGRQGHGHHRQLHHCLNGQRQEGQEAVWQAAQRHQHCL
mmetsp:Transcript_1620/g.2971  ORF Transcript_1620/g.2971 Transcript_1620/m.2971 type:complete len:225 (+) Transcript_1620:378-1052(+)